MLQERVAADSAFVKADNLGTQFHGLPGQFANPCQVEGLVGVAMLELRSGHANVSHGNASFIP
jgi:hypothetical protein